MPDSDIKTKADEKAVAEGCYLDEEAAGRVKTFFGKFLRHSKGRWAGKRFELLPWQWNDVIRPLFGWKRADGSRRFRRAYIEIPKKNGKSTLCSGLALYLLVADGEAGAEVFSAAADRDQASIVWAECAEMVKASPTLSDHIEVIPSTKRLVFPRKASYYKALSADAYTKEGLNIHGLMFDELHAQPDRRLWDTLTYGGAAREQPLLIAITTAGFDRNSICWEQHQYAERILDGTFDDWSYFSYIRAAAETDDWTDERVWAAANPSLGATIQIDEMREACQAAQASATRENGFKRYRLNLWTQQEVRWLPLKAWDKCAGQVHPEDLLGRPCFAALDLSSTTDCTAFVLLFPEDGNAVLPFFFVPADNAADRERRDRVPYVTWSHEGLVTLTPGPVVDYSRVKAAVLSLAGKYRIQKLAVDRWNAEHLAQMLLESGLDVVGFGQGYASMSPAAKKLEEWVRSGNLRHGGNPVLRWMAGNATVTQDPAENIKPVKSKSNERIDGIVALCMCAGLSLTQPSETVYASRGLLSV